MWEGSLRHPRQQVRSEIQTLRRENFPNQSGRALTAVRSGLEVSSPSAFAFLMTPTLSPSAPGQTLAGLLSRCRSRSPPVRFLRAATVDTPFLRLSVRLLANRALLTIPPRAPRSGTRGE